MFSSTVASVNKSSMITTTNNAANGINKRPPACDTDRSIQGFKICK
jgi:hypothetical protein